MNKAFDVILLLSAFLVLCVVTPVMFQRQAYHTLQQSNDAYLADKLAWEIQTYQKIDASVLPSSTMKFICYNHHMEQVAVLSGESSYDFTPYFCVIFNYHSEKRGVHIE